MGSVNPPGTPEVLRATGSLLVLRCPFDGSQSHWRLEAQYRRASNFPFNLGVWESRELGADDVRACSSEGGGNSLEFTIRGLEPLTSYEIRLVASSTKNDDSQEREQKVHIGGVVKLKTAEPAPTLEVPPQLACARHDRLLLHWPEPGGDVGLEITAYRIRCSQDGDLRWREVEVKIAPRLLKPSERTVHFLQGEFGLKMNRIVRARSDTDQSAICNPTEDDGHEVHFWLTGLRPVTKYVVQVASVSTAGQGQWSESSEQFSTWRVAPQVSAPHFLAKTHTALVVGWSIPDNSHMDTEVQDEEVDSFKVSMVVSGSPKKRPEPKIESISRTAAFENARVMCDPKGGDSMFVAIIRDLQPQKAYTCTVVSITRAGIGDESLSSPDIFTLPVAPEIIGLKVEEIQHNEAKLTWQAAEDLCELRFGEVYAEAAEQRQLLGFDIRTSPDRGHETPWEEMLGVKARDMKSGERMGRCTLRDLEPDSSLWVQVAAVSRAGRGSWSEALQVTTDCLAPSVTPLERHVMRRESFIVKWPVPIATSRAPVLGYRLRIRPFYKRDFDEEPIDLNLGAEEDATDSQIWTSGGTGGANGKYHGVDHHSSIEPSSSSRRKIWTTNEYTYASLDGLQPDTAYVLQVAARTCRGVGDWCSESVFQTRRCAPSMENSPRLIQARCDRLYLRCDGPVQDWDAEEGEVSGVIGYSIRCREYQSQMSSRIGLILGGGAAWEEIYLPLADVEEEEYDALAGRIQQEGRSVRFWLTSLGVGPKHFVVQVAAVTSSGRGPWSNESSRLSTWYPAPTPTAPELLGRTHKELVVGWGLQIPPTSLGGDEEVVSFELRVSLVGKRTDQITTKVSTTVAEELGVRLRNAGHDDARIPSCVVVLRSLAAHQPYIVSVRAITALGIGDWSECSSEFTTVPCAQLVEDVTVEDVQHDCIVVSWPPLHPAPVPTDAECEVLEILRSAEELALECFEVRKALWGNWRLSFDEPELLEELDSEIQEVVRPPESSPKNLKEGFVVPADRPRFVVKDLKSEQTYAIEIRACSKAGTGEWCRVGSRGICTAIVAESPDVPVAVYATPHALTFSFSKASDNRIASYEVRLFETNLGSSWRTGQMTGSSKVRSFSSSSPGVRSTPEGRWVVTVDKLQSDTCHTLQLRGVTHSGCVTKWSEVSAAMRTEKSTGDHDFDEVAVHEGTSVPSGNPNEREMSLADFEAKLEQVISFLMKYSTMGVRLPSREIPSVAEQARILMQRHLGNVEEAVSETIGTDHKNTGWETALVDFLVSQVPVVGCSTILLRELWENIRKCALVAQLYGHDLTDPEVSALLMTCLVPASSSTPSPSSAHGGAEPLLSGKRVALMVSRAIAKESLIRATGMKSIGSLFEVAGNLLRTQGQLSAGWSGHSRNPTKSSAHTAPPAPSHEGSPPRPFGPTSSDSSSSPQGEPIERSRSKNGVAHSETPPDARQESVAGGDCDEVLATPAQVARAVFRPPHVSEHPVSVLALLALSLLPVFVATIRFVIQRVLPILAMRIQMEVSLGTLGFLVLLGISLGVGLAAWLRGHINNFVSLPATLVFVVYAALPSIGVYMATNDLIHGLREAYFFVVLALFNFSSGFLRWASDMEDEKELQEAQTKDNASPVKAESTWTPFKPPLVRYAQRVIWIVLLCDFAAEEVVGRLLGLHNFVLLGPPKLDDHVSLWNYRTLSFAIGLLAAWAQKTTLEILQTRTVLLRLLGARKGILSGLVMLFMGAFASVRVNGVVAFLRDVSPSPKWCCIVLAWRHVGVVAGVAVPLVLHAVSTDPDSGSHGDVALRVALLAGMILGMLVASTFWRVWYTLQSSLEADDRVLLLFPRTSTQARQKATAVMSMAMQRGKEITTTKATEWAAMRLARTACSAASAGGEFLIRGRLGEIVSRTMMRSR